MWWGLQLKKTFFLLVIWWCTRNDVNTILMRLQPPVIELFQKIKPFSNIQNVTKKTVFKGLFIKSITYNHSYTFKRIFEKLRSSNKRIKKDVLQILLKSFVSLSILKWSQFVQISTASFIMVRDFDCVIAVCLRANK